MDNDDNQPNDGNNNEYGNEDYEGAEDGGENNNDAADENADQYFDDAGDIGYLPADHVTPFNFLTAYSYDSPWCNVCKML